MTPVRDWQICDAFELYVVEFKDIHYLILPPSTAKEICRETSGTQPYPASRIIDQEKAREDLQKNQPWYRRIFDLLT